MLSHPFLKSAQLFRRLICYLTTVCVPLKANQRVCDCLGCRHLNQEDGKDSLWVEIPITGRSPYAGKQQRENSRLRRGGCERQTFGNQRSYRELAFCADSSLYRGAQRGTAEENLELKVLKYQIKLHGIFGVDPKRIEPGDFYWVFGFCFDSVLVCEKLWITTQTASGTFWNLHNQHGLLRRVEKAKISKYL